ncbi:arginine--tRNA ligase [Blattabacterium cuenoti]|uniref:arginine--tRNA ligase n=1 Tax=Blattabacterium cuenoti TaxID=1653831 RepID=UPI00163C70B5|nr:arginine--tRNA ligase [Blattabacterium cuenoti]
MNDYFQLVEELVKKLLYDLYKFPVYKKLDFKYTNKDHSGDLTLILFSLSKELKKPVNEVGSIIGSYVKEKLKGYVKFYIVEGFLNFIFKDNYYVNLINIMLNSNFYNLKIKNPKKIMVEYSSPNANKPLHLGHLRNCLIGVFISKILKMFGHNIIRTQIINDRGIHICKSMIAWIKFGKGKTPNDCSLKGDHFVGKYYNLFDKIYKEEINNVKNNNEVSILKDARNLLIKWENKDTNTISIWKKMNQWVYDGFKKTYHKIGISFDKTEYESKIYEIGKNIVKKGLEKNIFFKKKDGSVWIDLSKEGFYHKLLLRSDQTSVYLTQDLGNAVKRFNKYKIDNLVYVVGKEQNYHFKTLFAILKRLGFIWVNKLYHLSYEMVTLPSGRMKSREGNVVTVDSIINEIISIAKKKFLKKASVNTHEKTYNIIGIGALKYHFLKVDPKKEISFDINKSISLKGRTGTYVQYTYSRIRSLERKFFKLFPTKNNFNWKNVVLDTYEKNLIKILSKYPLVLKKSCMYFNPSLVANYVYEVSKCFNNLYQNKKLLDTLNVIQCNANMTIICITGNILKYGMNLLGIDMVDKM